jgi:hypothetical protein
MKTTLIALLFCLFQPLRGADKVPPLLSKIQWEYAVLKEVQAGSKVAMMILDLPNCYSLVVSGKGDDKNPAMGNLCMKLPAELRKWSVGNYKNNLDLRMFSLQPKAAARFVSTYELCNLLGQAGFEMVSVNYRDSEGSAGTTYYFKRLKLQGP